MSSTAATDWQAVEEAITLVLRDGKLPTRSKEAIKRGLAARNDSNAVLEALCVLDSLALNCGRTFRSGFAAPKWMKRLTQCCSASPQTAPAVAQLLANWELTFRGEELGASAHATRKQMQASIGTLPQPNRFAHEMREYFEQHIPFIGFQHGFNFLEAFSTAGSVPSRGGEGENTSRTMPPQARPVPPFRVDYLKDMSADLHNLEACTAAIQLARHAQGDPQHEDRMQKGDALASKCCQWRASIQEWAADELLSYSLADLLVMNDRLHAELDRWDSAVRSLVLAQSLPMAPSSAAFDSTTQDHSQWFSPLGSSASRFMDTLSPSFPASPSSASDQPASAGAAQERAAASRGGALSSSSEPKAQPATAKQQNKGTPGAGIMAPDLGTSHAGWARDSISGSTGVEAGAFNSWVAFPESAQPGLPELPSAPQHLHAASMKPAQHPILTAQKTAQHSVAAQLRPVTSEAASVSFFSGPVASHVPVVHSKQASTRYEPGQDWLQSVGNLASPSREASRQVDQDLLQWDSPEQQLMGQQRPGAASEAAGPTVSSEAGESAATRSQLSSGGQMDTVPGNAAARGAQPFPDLSSSVLHSQAKPLLQASKPESDLHTLQAQLDAERSARAEAERALETSRAKEGALQRQLTELQDRLRDRELELWKARLDAKAEAKLVNGGEGGGEGKGELKQQGKVHAITAWCHHPALRVRFSAGQLAALAARTCSEA